MMCLMMRNLCFCGRLVMCLLLIICWLCMVVICIGVCVICRLCCLIEDVDDECFVFCVCVCDVWFVFCV